MVTADLYFLTSLLSHIGSWQELANAKRITGGDFRIDHLVFTRARKKSCTPRNRVTQQLLQALIELSTSQFLAELILFSNSGHSVESELLYKIILKCK